MIMAKLFASSASNYGVILDKSWKEETWRKSRIHVFGVKPNIMAGMNKIQNFEIQIRNSFTDNIFHKKHNYNLHKIVNWTTKYISWI